MNSGMLLLLLGILLVAIGSATRMNAPQTGLYILIAGVVILFVSLILSAQQLKQDKQE